MKVNSNDKRIVGYTAGVFDLFHIGHLNLLKRARAQCDSLIVGVTNDELVHYKGKASIIPFEERIEIVRSIKYVDKAVAQDDLDKFKAWEALKFNKIFVGDDWKGSKEWDEYERKFNEVGVEVVYFPYTMGTSSTIITDILKNSHMLIKQAEKEETASKAAKKINA